MADPLMILQELLRSLQRPQLPEQVMQQAVALIARLTDWPGVVLLAPHAEGEVLQVSASAGRLVPEWDSRVSMTEGVVAGAWQNGVARFEADAHTVSQAFAGLKEVASLMVVPLKQAERVRLLLVVIGDKPMAFDTAARMLAESLAEVITLALQNARLYRTLQEELTEREQAEDRLWMTIRKTETLYRVSRSLIGPYEFEQVLRNVVYNVAGALRADRVLLVSLDMENQSVRDFITGGPEGNRIQPLTFAELTEGLPAWVMREGLPVLVCDNEVNPQESPAMQRWREETEAGSMGVVPLLFRDRTYGILMAINRHGQPDFAQQDVDLLVVIAAQIASAMQNAELIQTVMEERGRLRALVQSSRDGVVLIGADLRLLVVNRPVVHCLGLPGEPEDWVGRTLWGALSILRDQSSGFVRDILNEMRRVRAGDENPGEGEYQVGAHYIHWLNLPILGTERAIGRLLVLRDVTEARLLEQFREDLTHTMVHDLRNPLTGIYAALKLLSGHARDYLLPDQQHILDIASTSTQRMLKLVNGILDISRLESGQMPMSPTAFRLCDAVSVVLAMEQPLIEQRSLQVVNAITERLPPVWADRELIERVLQNLLSNAVKFTPSGGEVRLSAVVGPDAPDKLQVSVSDAGSGIPPEIEEHIFQKFVSGQQKERGSGLGLAFCRMVLESHGERIWVASTSEQGTTLAFTLPLAANGLEVGS